MNEEGKCVVARAHREQQVPTGCVQEESDKCKTCSTQCKPLTVFEVDAIVSFKTSFGLPVEKTRQAFS